MYICVHVFEVGVKLQINLKDYISVRRQNLILRR